MVFLVKKDVCVDSYNQRIKECMHVCGVIKQIWTEYIHMKSTYNFINFLPLEISLLQTLCSEPSDYTILQCIL